MKIFEVEFYKNQIHHTVKVQAQNESEAKIIAKQHDGFSIKFKSIKELEEVV